MTINSSANIPLHAWRGLPVPYWYIYGDVHCKALILLVNFNSWCTRLYRLPNRDSQRILKESGVKKRVITGERKCHTKSLLKPTTKSKHFWLILKPVNHSCTRYWNWLNAMEKSYADEIISIVEGWYIHSHPWIVRMDSSSPPVMKRTIHPVARIWFTTSQLASMYSRSQKKDREWVFLWVRTGNNT